MPAFCLYKAERVEARPFGRAFPSFEFFCFVLLLNTKCIWDQIIAATGRTDFCILRDLPPLALAAFEHGNRFFIKYRSCRFVHIMKSLVDYIFLIHQYFPSMPLAIFHNIYNRHTKWLERTVFVSVLIEVDQRLFVFREIIIKKSRNTNSGCPMPPQCKTVQICGLYHILCLLILPINFPIQRVFDCSHPLRSGIPVEQVCQQEDWASYIPAVHLVVPLS